MTLVVNGNLVTTTANRIPAASTISPPSGRVFTRDQLLDSVWRDTSYVTPRSVDVYVRRIREKIERTRRILAISKPCAGPVTASRRPSEESSLLSCWRPSRLVGGWSRPFTLDTSIPPSLGNVTTRRNPAQLIQKLCCWLTGRNRSGNTALQDIITQKVGSRSARHGHRSDWKGFSRFGGRPCVDGKTTAQSKELKDRSCRQYRRSTSAAVVRSESRSGTSRLLCPVVLFGSLIHFRCGASSQRVHRALWRGSLIAFCDRR